MGLAAASYTPAMWCQVFRLTAVFPYKKILAPVVGSQSMKPIVRGPVSAFRSSCQPQSLEPPLFDNTAASSAGQPVGYTQASSVRLPVSCKDAGLPRLT